MAKSVKRVCWDACTWIALIQRERITDTAGNLVEDRYSMSRAVIDAAKAGKIEIVISGLCLIEVNKDPAVRSEGHDTLADFFEHGYIITVGLDRFVGERGRSLMRSGLGGLKPQDAAHLATAAMSNVAELHTFDDKLLALDRKIDKLDGSRLRICKPDPNAGPPRDLPLIEGMKLG